MIAQYTQAALVAENRRLAAPASVGSIPTSAMQEDHVSMGWGAAPRLGVVLENLARILAVELVVRGPRARPAPAAAPGAGDGRGAAGCCAPVGGPGPDRWLAPELAAAEDLVARARCSTPSRLAVGALA